MAETHRIDELRDIGDESDVEERLRELEARRDELEDELGAMDRDDEDRIKVERLEQEVNELEALLEQRRGDLRA